MPDTVDPIHTRFSYTQRAIQAFREIRVHSSEVRRNTDSNREVLFKPWICSQVDAKTRCNSHRIAPFQSVVTLWIIRSIEVLVVFVRVARQFSLSIHSIRYPCWFNWTISLANFSPKLNVPSACLCSKRIVLGFNSLKGKTASISVSNPSVSR